MTTLTDRPSPKSDFAEAWQTTVSGRPWWGNSYMAIAGEPFWSDIEPQDLAERLSGGKGARPFRRSLLRWVGEHNRCETYEARLSDLHVFTSLGGDYLVRLAHSGRNGKLLRGIDKSAGPCIINARFAALIERRMGPGTWYVTANRAAFVYDVNGRARAVVMGVRPHGAKLKSYEGVEATNGTR